MDSKIILPKLREGKCWNKGPMVVTGCTKVSPGCDNCWSERAHAMRQNNGDVSHIYSPDLMTPQGHFNRKVQFNLHLLEKACRTRKPQVIALWNDLYHEGVTMEQVTDAHCMMAEYPRHIYLIVTKRPARAANYINDVIAVAGLAKRLPSHMWHIVTMENQEMVEERMPHLLEITGKRGIIIEPILGPVDLTNCREDRCNHFNSCNDSRETCDVRNYDLRRIHQVILGGETGCLSRPVNPAWVRSVRDQCDAAGVPFYFKAWGEWAPDQAGIICESFNVPVYRVGKKKAGRLLDGREHNDLAWVTE